MVSDTWWLQLYTFTLQLHRSASSPQRGSAAGLHQGWWWGVVLVNTPQQAVSYTLESGVKTKYVFTVCVSSHPCVVVFSLWFSRACSLSLTDAWQRDHAASLWSTIWRRFQRQHVPRHGDVHLPGRLHLQRSLSREQVRGCIIPLMFSEKSHVLQGFPNDYTVRVCSNWCAMVQVCPLLSPE